MKARGRFILNPGLFLKAEDLSSDSGQVIVCAPIRGKALKVTEFPNAEWNKVGGNMGRLLSGGRLSAAEKIDRADLIRAGVFVRKSQVPLPIAYRCDGSDMEEYAQSPLARFDWPLGEEFRKCRWATNPDVLIAERFEFPGFFEDASSLPKEYFSGSGPVVWTRDPLSGTWCPVWPGRGMLRAVRRLLSDKERALGALPEKTLRLFVHCRIVVPEESLFRGWREGSMRRQRSRFRRRHLAALPGFLPPLAVVGFRKYYRDRVKNGYVEKRNDGISIRYAEDNDPLAEYLFGQFTPVASFLMGKPMTRSFTYMAHYLRGSALSEHRDKPDSMEVCFAFHVDYEPRTTDAKRLWPIRFRESKNVARWETQLPGDCLVFQGHKLAHSRRPMKTGRKSVSLLFFYKDGRRR